MVPLLFPGTEGGSVNATPNDLIGRRLAANKRLVLFVPSLIRPPPVSHLQTRLAQLAATPRRRPGSDTKPACVASL